MVNIYVVSLERPLKTNNNNINNNNNNDDDDDSISYLLQDQQSNP